MTWKKVSFAGMITLTCCLWLLGSASAASVDTCDIIFQSCMDSASFADTACKSQCTATVVHCKQRCDKLGSKPECYTACEKKMSKCLTACKHAVYFANYKCKQDYEKCPSQCDDGSLVVCATIPPTCPTGTILAAQNQCWACVDPQTCQPPCDAETSYDPTLNACCPDTIYIADCFCPGMEVEFFSIHDENGCLLGTGCQCVPGKCDDGTSVLCDVIPPECPFGTILAVQDGCFSCVDPDTCASTCEEGTTYDPKLNACCPDAIFVADCYCPGMDIVSTEVMDEKGCLLGYGCECIPNQCGDGTELLCDMLPPDCPAGTILTVQNHCFECVDPGTCKSVCNNDSYYDPKLDACCPLAIFIADCLCLEGYDLVGFSVFNEDGCLLGFSCTCTDPACSDGTALTCNEEPPACPAGTILSIQNGCWICADPKTCKLGCAEDCDCYSYDKNFSSLCEETCETCDNYWQCVSGVCTEACGPVPDPISACEGGQVGDPCGPDGGECASGLACCYPCGIPDCTFTCTEPCPTGTPGCFGGCFLFP
ncbi:MAG: hypothetical protein HUU55_15405 [Myxococcales bacterium]|nr:hypothetical protein [Myxococcales bacterium]